MAALLLLTATACAGNGSRQASTSAPATPAADEKRAPDFTLETFEGDTFTLSDHFGELPIVLNFWAPW
jgi:cytochrome oxidase Cu insertion factor (SCO1/SenC/PrrC family)